MIIRMNTKEIYIIRHGQTQFNVTLLSNYKDYDEPLTAIGEKQAEMTGQYLAEFHLLKPFDAVFISPYKRTRHTAEIILSKINKQSNIIITNDIRELNHSGKLYGKDISKQGNEGYNYYNAVQKIKHHYRDPLVVNWDIKRHPEKYDLIPFYEKYNIELPNEAYNRVNNFLQTIFNSPYQKILVVTHSEIVAMILSILLNVDSYLYGTQQETTNCGITYFVITDGIPKFKLIQDTSHFNLYANPQSQPVTKYVLKYEKS